MNIRQLFPLLQHVITIKQIDNLIALKPATAVLGQASQEHVGAVGAKLLFPDSTLIQHVGITNTISGPGHKLKKLDDKNSIGI